MHQVLLELGIMISVWHEQLSCGQVTAQSWQ